MQSKIASKIIEFLRNEDGPTSVEYAIMIAMILVGMLSAILSTGDIQRSMFFNSSEDIEAVVNGTYQP